MDLNDVIIRKEPKKYLIVQSPEHQSKSIGTVILSQLLPFRRYMITHLQRKGFSTKKLSFKDMVVLYYNEFISNKNNDSSPFVPVNSYEFSNSPVFRIKKTDKITGTFEDFRNADGLGMIGNIVENTINTFKFVRNKKKQAVQSGINPKDVMSDIELWQAYAVEQVEKSLKNKYSDSYSLTKGSVISVIKWGIVLYLFYYLFFKS